MDSITLRLESELIEGLDSEADDRGVSRSEYAREILRSRNEHARIQEENERLRRQLQAMSSRQEDVGELVEYVERERSLQEQERERRNAPAWRRAKWWLLGRSDA
jgi:metal-responsive CopG/Arc/MetJ family transcriptional regulator